MQPTQRDQGKCSLSTIVALHTGHQYTWQRSCLSRHSMHRHTCRHRKTRDGIIPQCILKRPWLKHTSEIKPSGIGVARNNSGTLIRYSPIWLCHSWPKLEYISLFWEAVQSVSMLIDYEVIIIRLNSPFRAKFDDKTSTKLRSGLFDQLGHVLDLRDRKRIFEILCRI